MKQGNTALAYFVAILCDVMPTFSKVNDLAAPVLLLPRWATQHILRTEL